MSTAHERAPFGVACLDVWPPQTLSRPAMEAYRALEAKGLLEMDSVQVGRHTGSVKIRYRTQIPHEWILQELKDEKCKIAFGGEQTEWKTKEEHA